MATQNMNADLTGSWMTTSGHVQSDDPITDTSGSGQRVWSANAILSVLYIIFGCVGLIGNSFVILVIFNYTAMRKSLTNLLIINQSLVDSVSSVVVILSVTLTDRGDALEGVSGHLLCRLWYSKAFLWGSLAVSTFNLLAITVERFLCITRPVWYKNSATRGRVLAVCVLVWFLGIGLQSIIGIIPAGLDENRKCNFYYFWPSKQFQQGIGAFTIVLKFFLPLGIMIYCYIKMAAVLKSRVKPSGVGAPKADDKKDGGRMAKARQNIFKTLITVTVCFSICWTPNQCVFFYFNLGNWISFSSWYYHGSTMLVYFNCCCNPFIYIAQYEQFQNGVRKLKGKLMKQPEETSVTNTTQVSI